MLVNVSFLFRRDGTHDEQYKLHLTPDEHSYRGVKGGERLKVMDTDVGKIGILGCYDCEFPELGRLLAEQGMRILFMPLWTDTRNGFLRAGACAIENECYVAITGNVGNLPEVENADIQYSQSTVFSPRDFAFPHDGIVVESTPNTEMTLIADLDLNRLRRLRNEGSVQNFPDRRLDLYRIQWLGGTTRTIEARTVSGATISSLGAKRPCRDRRTSPPRPQGCLDKRDSHPV